MQNSERLGTEKINKLLFSLSMPAFIAMFVNGLYNIIDTIFIGHGVGTIAIGGIAIAFPIQMLYMAFSQMIGIGSASAISRTLGEDNDELANQIATNAFVLMIIISIILTLLTLFFMDPILYLFGATDELLPYAKEYVSIIALGVIFNSIALTSNAIFRAEGNIKIGMISVLIGALLSICLCPLFIFVFGLGIKGAALATISAQFASCVYCLFFLLTKRTSITLKFKYIIPHYKIAWDIFSVGFSAFARNAASSLFALIANSILRIYGGTFAILTFGVVNRIISFFFLPIMGVNQGFQPIASYNYGAHQYERIRQVLKLALISTTVICIAGWLVGLIFPSYIIRLFTNDTDLILESSRVLRIKLLFFPTLGLQMVTSTLFQSLGKALPALFLSLLRQFLILLPLVLILPRITNLGVNAVWYSFPISDFLGFIITTFILIRQYKTLKNLKPSLQQI
ncbi:MAG: MATE family efflux transporter [Turicibacter sp.]